MAYERRQDLVQETNWWNSVPQNTKEEDNLARRNSDSRKGGFPPYHPGYGFFRGRRAAPDLEAQEHKWQKYHRIRSVKPQNHQKGHHVPTAGKPGNKKGGFPPYRAGYGYFRGRRSAI